MTKTINPNTKCTLLQIKDNTQEKTFENTLIDAVDTALATFSQTCMQTIYSHLEKTFKIKRQEIPRKTKEFAEALEQIFGESSKIIEIRIIEELHKRHQNFVHFPKKRKLNFIEYLTDLQAFTQNTNAGRFKLCEC
ncbi:MAG: hypothetical protein QW166_02350 [Candidatus Bathyarchaeia archaeon]